MAELDILLPQHQELIAASGITPEVAKARGYGSVTTRAELERLGFSKRQRLVPCLLVPIWNVHGEIGTYQIRPDQPRISNGKVVKYETPRGTRMVLDIPPGARQWLGVPRRPLFVTEGARKADAAVGRGLCCIALLGVWNWRGTNDEGGKTALPDWEAIALNDRKVHVCFDSDLIAKVEVRAALRRLGDFLKSRGATVKVVVLPAGDGGSKIGLDDFFASGGTVEQLLARSLDELPRLEQEFDTSQTYQSSPQGLIYLKPVQGAFVPVQLTNFDARIVSEITHDDGQERTFHFEMSTRLADVERRFEVPARQFPGMGWVVEQMGASAIVYPGSTLKDHARCAIQSLSRNIQRRSVYTHLGWRDLDGRWVYLHAGGAIGAEGGTKDIEVAPPDALGRYVLPEPPKARALIKTIRASLRLLRVAPPRLMVPVLGATYRSVLGPSNFAVHMSGQTGEGKTAVAALCQQHFGPGMNADSLPGSWSSTGNALEVIAFGAKDALLVVDDFVPRGNQAEAQRQHREAERLFRAQGNAAGRQRLRPDATLRPVKLPRGLVLSTGEDIPRGHSLRARLLVLEVSPGDVDWHRLTTAQRRAARGDYAEATSGFLQWLAERYDAIQRRLPAELREVRDEMFRTGQHRRTSFIVASLALGFRYFLEFARDVGAIRVEESEGLWVKALDALGEVAAAQQQHHEADEPTRRFFALLAGAIASGHAHVATADGGQPDPPGPWGWRTDVTNTAATCRAYGDRIGWIDGDNLYLEPEASYAAAQRQAREGSDALAVSARTLHKRLAERRYLVSWEVVRGVLTVRRSLDGKRRDVLHLHAATLSCREPDQPDQPPSPEAEEPGSLSDAWSGSWSGTAPRPDQQPDQSEPREPGIPTPTAASGRVGRVSGKTKSRLDSADGDALEVTEL